jgi:hypothetical protein
MTVRPEFWTRSPISSVAEFLSILASEAKRSRAARIKDDAVLRGHRCEEWPLTASVGREKWKGKVENSEKLIFNEFVRTSPRLHYLATNDDWDRLAVAQHHGLSRSRRADKTPNVAILPRQEIEVSFRRGYRTILIVCFTTALSSGKKPSTRTYLTFAFTVVV